MALLPNFIARRPHPAEFDFAGTVVASRTPALALGAPVFGWLDVPTQLSTRQGALAQFVRVAADRVTPRPPGMRARDACGLGVAGVSAHQTLFAAAGVQPGQTVFVNGGSSSVGAFAIQLAKVRPYRVMRHVRCPDGQPWCRRKGARSGRAHRGRTRSSCAPWAQTRSGFYHYKASINERLTTSAVR
jgi:NADPH:quinone reductase-like Zn-dependent oxidoreductase